MKTTELNASLREETGKRVTKALRKAGKIPGVIYDNSAVKHIYVDAKEARKIVYTPDTHIVKLNVDGEVVDTIVREMQFHPVKEYVEHIDFLRVTDERPVEVVLPVRLIGVPKGVATGGKLVVKLRKVKVKGIPSQLPETLDIDVSELELGGTIKLGEAELGDLKVVTSLSAAVASVEIPRSLRSAQAGSEEEGEGEEGAAEEAEA